MTTVTWWVHERRRCGRQAFVLPVAAALVVYAAFAAGPDDSMLLARSLLTCALPAATAVACAAVVARESLRELHGSLPTPYARTVARRLAWPAAVTVVTALALVAAVAAEGHAREPGAVLLELTGFTVLLGGAAVWTTVRSGSPAPATGLVVAIVGVKLLLVDRVVPAGAGRTVPALLVGTGLMVLALRDLAPGGRTTADRLARGGRRGTDSVPAGTGTEGRTGGGGIG
ncbi:hypothetical protein ACWD6I_08375 [Streptomyces sp. NPDC002454]